MFLQKPTMRSVQRVQIFTRLDNVTGVTVHSITVPYIKSVQIMFTDEFQHYRNGIEDSRQINDHCISSNENRARSHSLTKSGVNSPPDQFTALDKSHDCSNPDIVQDGDINRSNFTDPLQNGTSVAQPCADLLVYQPQIDTKFGCVSLQSKLTKVLQKYGMLFRISPRLIQCTRSVVSLTFLFLGFLLLQS